MKTNHLFSNKDLKKLIIPLVLEQTLAITVGMADTMMISSVGEAAVSGVSLVDMLNMLIFTVLSSLATGGAVINIPLLLNLNFVLSIYGLGAETTQLSYILVMIHNGFGIFLWPLSFVLPYMLRACNDVRYPMVISIFSMIVFRIGFSYVLGVQYGMGAVGVWIAMVIDWVFRSGCFVGRYFHGDWKMTMYKLR